MDMDSKGHGKHHFLGPPNLNAFSRIFIKVTRIHIEFTRFHIEFTRFHIESTRFHTEFTRSRVKLTRFHTEFTRSCIKFLRFRIEFIRFQTELTRFHIECARVRFQKRPKKRTGSDQLKCSKWKTGRNLWTSSNLVLGDFRYIFWHLIFLLIPKSLLTSVAKEVGHPQTDETDILRFTVRIWF